MVDKTMRDLASDALFVLDACNLSGVVHGMSRTMTRLRELKPDRDTEFYNTHPIAVLFATKIAELTHVAALADEDTFTRAYNWAKAITTVLYRVNSDNLEAAILTEDAYTTLRPLLSTGDFHTHTAEVVDNPTFEDICAALYWDEEEQALMSDAFDD